MSRDLTRRAFTLGIGAGSIAWLKSPAQARIIWPGGAKAAVSLTYDDGLDSQLANVAPLLDELSFKATFFLTVENMRGSLSAWQSMEKKGHEIGDHTMTHPCRLGGYSSERFMEEEIAPAEKFLDANFAGPKPRCFAYPCGFQGLGSGTNPQRVRRYKDVLGKTFLAARTVDGPPNDPRQTLTRRYFLNGFEPTYDIDHVFPAMAYLRKAVAQGSWAILIFHEVLASRRGEGDTSIGVHRKILELTSDLPVWCAPMGTVFKHISRSA
jgi:peptidoglycan/xylan/chitin deacetylase (PgdA/CDA1 family)